MDTDGTTASAPTLPTETKPTVGRPRELHPNDARRGNKPLPTNRISFAKQLDLLRAYGAAGGMERKAVPINAAAEMVGLSPATASLANGFFVEAKFLAKVDGPQPLFQPSVAVYDFSQAHAWAPDTAAQKLAPALQTTWAWTALETRLKYASTLPEAQTIHLLAEACGASPEYQPHLILILQFLEAGGLLTRDGGIVRRVEGRANATPPVTPTPEIPAENGSSAERARNRSGDSTNGGGRVEGQFRFAISMNFDMAELRNWSPDRIASLFEGVSMVMKAKSGMEEEPDEG